MKVNQPSLLRFAFLTGAVTDAVALLPMLVHPLGDWLWDIPVQTDAYYFAMRFAAALMLGWTVLLAWAARRPLERRFVALLTMVVVCGLAAAEILAVCAGVVAAPRMAPTWCLQAGLLILFGLAYHFPFDERKIRISDHDETGT